MAATLDASLKILYVQGLAVDVDQKATDQLRKASAELQITTIAGSAAALAELRRTPGWQALFASPSLAQNEVLALIASLRRDRIPIAIVPILDDAHQDLFASAVATGADDVLVRRNGALVNINETLTRIRQSPHRFPAEQRRRISVLYAGLDPLVWNLLDQVPFVRAERVAPGVDGTCSVRLPGSGDDSLRTDAVIIDEAPGDAHPLQVLKSVKAQASDLPVIMLTSAGAADIATAALELGADDTVLKTGIFRRRLIATLRRVHQRIELTAQQQETRTREERLRQIVENVPTGIMVVAGDARVLAMNAAALQLFGAVKPRDIVGRDFRDMTGEGDREAITELLHQVTKGEARGLTFEARTLTGNSLQAHIEAVVLERDARGGRGLVASITRAEHPVSADAGEKAAELASLRDALETLERHYAELESARSNERTAWETERQRLETRLEEAEKLAAERLTISERLDEVTAELARTSQSFAGERQALELRLQELEAAARESSKIGTAHDELEAALDAIREEQRQAIAAHALERSGWQDIRAELEARVQHLDGLHQSEQDTFAASLRQDVQRLEQTLAEERERWQTTREQLDIELRNTREALWAEHTERDATRATLEADADAVRRTLEQDRAEWQQVRTALEAELADARALAGSERDAFERSQADLQRDLTADRSRLESELEAARQQRAIERAASDAELAGAREQAAHAEEALRTLTAEHAAARVRLEQERDEARSALEHSHAGLQDQISRIEADLFAARATAESASQELNEARQRWADEQAALEQARSDERADWHARQAALEAALAQATADATERDSTWQRERAELLQAAAEARTYSEQERGHLVSLHAREVEEWRRAVDQARSDRDQALTRLRTLEAELDGARPQPDEVDRLRTELGHARIDLDTTRADREHAQQRIAGLEADLADARRQIDDLDHVRAELGRLRIDLDTTRADRDHRVASLESDLAEARRVADDRHSALEAALSELRHTDTAHRDERETWQRGRQALELELREAQARHHDERNGWNQARAGLEAELREATRLDRNQQSLNDTIASLQNEIAALVAAQADARFEAERLRQELESMRASLADNQAHLSDVNSVLDRATQSTDEEVARQRARHEARERELSDEVRQLSARLTKATEDAEVARAELLADRERASADHGRLIASDAFGYALTTMTGELVRCNDAFARMFGYATATDAQKRTEGRPFPGLSGRSDIDARLVAAGRLDRVTSCIERADGRAGRIIESAAVLQGTTDSRTGEPLVERIVVAGPAGPTPEEAHGRRLQEVGSLTTAMTSELESLAAAAHERSTEIVRLLEARKTASDQADQLRTINSQMATLVRQLAVFSRRQAREPEPIDLGDAVRRSEPVLGRLVGDYIAFTTDCGTTTPVTAQPEDLDQLLTSLVTLGRDLLPAGGSMSVQVRHDDGTASSASLGVPGPVLAVLVSGYGAQLPGPTAALGLIAQRCGGTLRVTGETGWQVRLEVLFPRCGMPSRPSWNGQAD
jgi:PAS domain S-box-containing protein